MPVGKGDEMEEIFGVVLLVGPAILAWQGYSWLKAGFWTALPLSKVFAYFGWPMPSTDWLGAQKILDSFFDLPVSGVVFVLSIVFFALCVWAEAVFLDYRSKRTN
jgi:hypothetical protein